jgi:hypothetical protein
MILLRVDLNAIVKESESFKCSSLSSDQDGSTSLCVFDPFSAVNLRGHMADLALEPSEPSSQWSAKA